MKGQGSRISWTKS